MIDRHALEVIAANQFESMASPSGVSLFLHLINGERYAVNEFVEFHDTYFVAAMYPHQALNPDDLGKVIPKDAKGNLIFDRVIIPYHTVAYVAISAQEPEKRSGLGFNV
jgi:hypothetical protein